MRRKKGYMVAVVVLACSMYLACGNVAGSRGNQQILEETQRKEIPKTETENTKAEDSEAKETEISYINPEGTNLKDRIKVPDGYERTQVESGSFGEFVRNYPMKEDGAKVLLYDGREKGNQSAHAAVFALPIENVDLQQCADSIMRMYGEYNWSLGAYDKIKYHFTNGFLAEYEKWQNGNRIVVDGNQVYWSKSTSYDESYESFVKYLRVVFSYAGTLSMEGESEKIALEEAAIGDVFLQGGSPGHVVMIADVCVNAEGKKAYLLAQGYMPAQEFHVLKNPFHEENPWYMEEEMTGSLRTPEYTFLEGSLRRLNYR